MPDKLSAIADVSSAIVAGSATLPSDGILIGWKLADDLGLHIGQTILVRSDRQRVRSFRISGIFSLGIASADRQAIYMLPAVRALEDGGEFLRRVLPFAQLTPIYRWPPMLGLAG